MNKIDKRQAILDQYPDGTFLFADGFDAAILGVSGEFALLNFPENSL